MSGVLLSHMRVMQALESGDWTGVEEADLAVVDKPHADRLFREWRAANAQRTGKAAVYNAKMTVETTVALANGGTRVTLFAPFEVPLRPHERVWLTVDVDA